MEHFDVTQVNEQVAEKEWTHEEKCQFYWENLRDFLVRIKQETMAAGVLTQIEKSCPGFEEFVMLRHVSSEVKELLSRYSQKKSLRRKKNHLWKKNRELVRDATEYITFRETGKHYTTHTGILFSALKVERGEEKEYCAFKNIFMTCVINQDGKLCISKRVFDAFILLHPEYVRRLQEWKVPGYEEYLQKEKELNRRIEELSSSENGFEILLIMPDKTYKRLVD